MSSLNTTPFPNTTGPDVATFAQGQTYEQPAPFPDIHATHRPEKIRPFDHAGLLGYNRQRVRHKLSRIAEAANQD